MRAMLKALLIIHFAFTGFSAVASPQCESVFSESDFSKADHKFLKKYVYIQEAYDAVPFKRPSLKKTYQAIDNWKIENSTPWKMEQLAQELVLSRYDRKSFLQGIREIFFGRNLAEAVQIRYETLALRNELVHLLQKDGLLKESNFGKYQNFKNRNYNKYQLAKFVVINSVLYNYLGVPLYFPRFDLISNLEFSKSEIELVKKLGHNGAYNILKRKYKFPFRMNQALEKAPSAFLLSVSAITAYNYLSFQSENSKYEIKEDIIPKESTLYLEWSKKFVELNGRAPDTVSNPQDRDDWIFTERVIYRAWVDLFYQKDSRYPDLANPADLNSWQDFLIQFENPQAQ